MSRSRGHKARILALALTALLASEAQAQFPPWGQPDAPRAAPDDAPPPPPPQGGSRGENFSAGKSGAQLFASDCTGSGCHRGPQGLGKGRAVGTLAGFLREHYTNSRESASMLAGYLAGVGGEARPMAPAAREPRPPRSAARPAPSDDAARPDEPRPRRPAAERQDPKARPNPRTAHPAAGAAPAAAAPPAARPATPAAAPPLVEQEPPAPVVAPPVPEPVAPPPVAAPPAPAAAPPPVAPAAPAKPTFDIFD